MKFINYFFAAALCAGLVTSCSKNTPENPPAAGEKHLVISLNGLQSKAADPAEVLATDPNVDNIAIFITNGSDKIVRKVEVAKSTETTSDWVLLTGSGTGGLMIPNVGTDISKISIYGNYKAGSDTYVTGEVGDAITIATTAAQQQGSAVLYAGSANVNSFTVDVENVDGTNVSTYSGSVQIAPAVARIQIKSVTFAESGTATVWNKDQTKSATVTWDNLSGDLLGIYLNNFYGSYDGAAVAASLMTNTTATGMIKEGQWLFSTTDAAAYASYNRWNSSTTQYDAYDLDAFNAATDECFAFNFFPGATPYLHLNLANVKVDDPDTDITSSDISVYNPTLLPLAKFANVVEYTSGGDPVTFAAGKIYNMDVEIKPYFTHTDINPVAYHIELSVTIADWTEESIDPGFQQQ